jgi:hypothetical protein
MRRLAIALPRREQIRSWLLFDLLALHSVIASALVCVLLLNSWNHFPFAWVVATWALIGGVISVVRRMQSLPDEELNLAQWGRLPILLSPLTSICFGLVLFYLFSAGLVSGTIFPDMQKIYAYNLNPATPAVTPKTAGSPPALAAATPAKHSPKAGASNRSKPSSTSQAQAVTSSTSGQIPCTSVPRNDPPPRGAPSGFVTSNTEAPDDVVQPCEPSAETSTPKIAKPCKIEDGHCKDDGFDFFHWMLVLSFPEFAKLVIWAFISGFAENFVPDTLDSLVKRKKS